MGLNQKSEPVAVLEVGLMPDGRYAVRCADGVTWLTVGGLIEVGRAMRAEHLRTKISALVAPRARNPMDDLADALAQIAPAAPIQRVPQGLSGFAKKLETDKSAEDLGL